MFILHALTLIHCSDLVEFTDVMYVFGIQINELVKMHDIITHSLRIRRLLDELHESSMHDSRRQHRWLYGRQLRDAQGHVRRFSLLLYVAASASAVMVFVSALRKKNDTIAAVLPFASWLPMSIDAAGGLYYWLAYGLQAAYVLYLTPINITLDTFLTGLLHFVAVRLRVLRAEMQCLCGGDGATPTKTCTEHRRHLSDVVKYHQEVTSYVDGSTAWFN